MSKNLTVLESAKAIGVEQGRAVAHIGVLGLTQTFRVRLVQDLEKLAIDALSALEVDLHATSGTLALEIFKENIQKLFSR